MSNFAGDRFIPLRREKDWEFKFHTSNDYTTSDNSSPKILKNTDEKAKIAFDHLLKNEILGTSFKKISLVNNEWVGMSTECKNLFTYATPRKNIAPSSVSSMLKPSSYELLKFTTMPYKYNKHIRLLKILDAPDLDTNFYTNILDWSSSDNITVAIGGTVYYYNYKLNSNTVFRNFEPHVITSISWDPCGQRLAIGYKSGKISLWNVERDVLTQDQTLHKEQVNVMCWNDRLRTSGDHEKYILTYDIRLPTAFPPVLKYEKHNSAVCGLQWSPCKNYLASGGNDNNVFVWDKRSTKALHKFVGHGSAVKGLSWSPHQGGLLASGGGTMDRTIRFWNTYSGKLLHKIDTESQVCNLIWSHNTNDILSTQGYPNNDVQIWDYKKKVCVAKIKGNDSRILYSAMSPDKTCIITGSGEEVKLYQVFPNKKSVKSKRSLIDIFDNMK